MAKKESKPRAHVVERSGTSSTCATCRKEIAAGEVRFSEAYGSVSVR